MDTIIGCTQVTRIFLTAKISPTALNEFVHTYSS
jgi:hypothetical protein